MYRATTESITVTVEPFYLEEQSSPQDSRYFWAYRIRIANGGGATVQLMSRYWRITDALGRVQEVIGEGVVGEKPVLEPGESFEYTSGVPLPTPSGIMAGHYRMIGKDIGELDVEVPAFSLDTPNEARPLN